MTLKISGSIEESLKQRENRKKNLPPMHEITNLYRKQFDYYKIESKLKLSHTIPRRFLFI